MKRELTAVLTISCFAAGLIACEEKPTPQPKPDTAATATSVTAPAAGSASAAPGAKAGIPTPPKNLGPMKIPDDNPMTEAKVALGHQLFFDKRLSTDGSRACYSCHQNEDGTGGHDPLAIGAGDKPLTRHAPVMWNVGYLPRHYWDGRSPSLEAQMKGAWAGGNMGVGEDKLADKAKEIAAIDGYKKQFDEVFGEEGVTPDTIAKAVAAYERTLFCADTAWDKFQAGNKSAMTSEQQAGWKLFTGKAACISCHAPPFFSDAYASADSAYHNTGVGIEGKKKEEVDIGRKAVSKSDTDWAAFKTPSLRNVAKTAPYFHDGSAKTLEEAVRFMAKGGFANEFKDPRITDRELTDAEIQQLVAFLGALDCEGSLVEPKLP
ncbi:MAG: c-type cytochrome [Polyangiaceae bacterium]|nr:c-type cytochrome [Polyangiaceae bacterium]MCW5792283.1 c-type cytochrome [Polyangiaceae bacterium]